VFFLVLISPRFNHLSTLLFSSPPRSKALPLQISIVTSRSELCCRSDIVTGLVHLCIVGLCCRVIYLAISLRTMKKRRGWGSNIHPSQTQTMLIKAGLLDSTKMSKCLRTIISENLLNCYWNVGAENPCDPKQRAVHLAGLRSLSASCIALLDYTCVNGACFRTKSALVRS